MKNHFSRVVDDQNSERLQQGSNLFVCVCVCLFPSKMFARSSSGAEKFDCNLFLADLQPAQI